MADDRLQWVLARIDEENEQDPREELADGQMQPRELVYGRRMSARLAQYAPTASEALQVAARAQHIRRWEIPRDAYPMDRLGYRRWRSALATFHADVTAGILQEAGYDASFMDRVSALVQKRRLKKDEEAQTLEDVACLVFLEHYLTSFAQGQNREKLVDILRKTWVKMSDRGRAEALRIPMDADTRALIQEALHSNGDPRVGR